MDAYFLLERLIHEHMSEPYNLFLEKSIHSKMKSILMEINLCFEVISLYLFIHRNILLEKGLRIHPTKIPY
jgi:hypothetical protein